MIRRRVIPIALLMSAFGCASGANDPTPSGVGPELGPSAPGATGRTLPFRMPDGTVKQIAVDASNGRGWIGDMGFGRLDDMRVRSGPSDTDLRWPGGVVHYCFLRSPLDSSLDPRVDEEPVVEGAAAYIHARVPSVSFVRHGYCSELAPPADDVVIVRRHVEDGQNQDWSRADLGRQGGVQYLDLGFSVGQDGPTDGMLTVVHELMHSLGVYHEHQRPDRDAHVGICWLNVSRQGDYEIKDDQLILSKYDPHSRMHYRPNQNRIDNPIDLPAPCGTNTMYSLDASVSLEHNNNMTAEDINNLSAMYGYGIGLPVAGEGLGAAIAVGNFDGDAYDDIAIGAPNGSNGAGRVYLFKGTLRYPLGRRVLTSTAAKGDGFGSALASGDFNGDGIMDLAVGAPGSKVSGVASGAVIIYLGGRFRGALWDPTCAAGSPCDGTGTDMLDLPSRTITLGGALGSPTPAAGDELGAALVAGDFDGDGHDDLVVGAPGRNGGQGAAYFFRGRMLAPPPGTPPQPYLYQAITPASLGAPSARRFGASLARGDFDDDRKNDLALGAPGLTNSTAPAYAFVMKGTGTSIPAAWQAIPSPNGAGDEFGFAVASGRLFGDDNKAELIVGAPRTLNSHSVRAGAVHVYRWASGSPSAQMVHADELVTGASTEARFGHAVQALNFDVTGQWELAIGSPLYGGGRGRILMATSNGTSLSTGNDVVGTGDVYQLGRSLAAIVQQVGVEIPGLSNVVRLLAGAPASKAEAPFGFSNAGRVVGYAETGANAFSPLTKLTPMTRSPAAE